MRPPENWNKAKVTLGLVGVTTFAWLLAWLFGRGEWATMWGGFTPAHLTYDAGGMTAPFFLTPLTATLVHADFLHLLLNVVILAFCGRPVESVLGPVALGLLYLLGAYAAAAAQYAVNPLAATTMVGASGAISAVIGAYAMLFGRNKVKLANPTLALWLNALWLMAAWVVLQFCIGIALAGSAFLFGGEGIQVAVAAHIGGFLVGLLLANPLLLFLYRKA
ncbi:MAG TPA: rhomboid family intramembrane serine protease [Allosphingosinicella sp.]|jgi:membrane associated rhomboid family serine protease|nr:rhomboid family intramembrane serine protease [Allosphingosinicella sp.]